MTAKSHSPAKAIYQSMMKELMSLLRGECPTLCLYHQHLFIYAFASYSGAMKSFFEPLLADALKLIKRSLAKARAAKHDIRQVFVCGGGFGNDWFFEEFFRRLLEETEITACERIEE